MAKLTKKEQVKLKTAIAKLNNKLYKIQGEVDDLQDLLNNKLYKIQDEFDDLQDLLNELVDKLENTTDSYF